jgi:hypothetical protein
LFNLSTFISSAVLLISKWLSKLLGPIFTVIFGPLFEFFRWLGFRLTFNAIIMPVQFAFLGALFAARFLYFMAFTSLFVLIYNKVNEIFENITTMSTMAYMSTVFNFLDSIGFISALITGFSYFSVLIVPIFGLIISKMFIKSVQSFSDEYYKIGMLISSGWK